MEDQLEVMKGRLRSTVLLVDKAKKVPTIKMGAKAAAVEAAVESATLLMRDLVVAIEKLTAKIDELE